MKNFKTTADFHYFLHDKWLKFIDSGSEGRYYYSKINDRGYKIFDDEVIEYMPKYDISQIILDDDVKIESFIMPTEIFVVNGNFKGYETRHIKNNLFSDKNFEHIDILSFDFQNFKQAYKQMKIDVLALTKLKIQIYDLVNNLIYDGNRLYAIDTCGYRFCDDKDLLKTNLESLDFSIDTIFDLLLLYSDDKIPSRKELNLTVNQYFDFFIKEINKLKRKEKVYKLDKKVTF